MSQITLQGKQNAIVRVAESRVALIDAVHASCDHAGRCVRALPVSPATLRRIGVVAGVAASVAGACAGLRTKKKTAQKKTEKSGIKGLLFQMLAPILLPVVQDMLRKRMTNKMSGEAGQPYGF